MARSTLALVLVPLLVIFNQFGFGNTAARLIKLPLIRETTNKAGALGQPVISYYTPVTIGTPQVPFKVQFDVALNDLFVPHYNWNPFKINLHYSKGFQCKSSSTCKKTDRSYTIEYQHCKLTGKPYEDIITLVNAHYVIPSPVSNHTSNQQVFVVQNFLAISDASDARFKDLPIDGFFGLGPLGQSASTINNFLATLHSAGKIDNLQFSFWFNPILDIQPGGELTLGGVDTSRYQGQIFWHRLSGLDNQWSMNLQYVSIGNQVVSCHGENCKAVLSSAVNEVYGPRLEVQKIYNLLGTNHDSSGLELVDCRRISGLPVLTFTIDGIPYTLLPNNYIRKTTDGYIFKSETCYVAILPSNDNRKQWTLGTNFLGAYYSIFDITYRQIGFATLR